MVLVWQWSRYQRSFLRKKNKKRKGEHRDAARNNDSNSKLARHVNNTGHNMDFDNGSIAHKHPIPLATLISCLLGTLCVIWHGKSPVLFISCVILWAFRSKQSVWSALLIINVCDVLHPHSALILIFSLQLRTKKKAD